MALRGHNLSLVMDQHIPWYGGSTARRHRIFASWISSAFQCANVSATRAPRRPIGLAGEVPCRWRAPAAGKARDQETVLLLSGSPRAGRGSEQVAALPFRAFTVGPVCRAPSSTRAVVPRRSRRATSSRRARREISHRRRARARALGPRRGRAIYRPG